VKDRKEHLGDFEVVRKEYSHAHIWTFDVEEALKAPVTGAQRTKGKDFNVGAFSWSPDGKQIAFSATTNPDLINGHSSDIYLLNLADNSTKKLVAQVSPDNNPQWSPDGRQLVFSSAMGNPRFFHANSRLAIVGVDGGQPRSLTDAFDEQPQFVEWNGDGLYSAACKKLPRICFASIRQV
jgi:Tol biopolymer transport system component